MVVGAMAAGQVITTLVDVNRAQLPPFVETGSVGDVVELSYADVQVDDVRPAQYLGTDVSTDLASLAGGVYVVVSATVTADSEPTTMSSGWLETPDGVRYRASAKSGCATILRTQTGVPIHSLWCFDVPPDQLAGLSFHLARGTLRDPGDEEINGDAVAEVDLGVTRAEEGTWATTTKAYRVEPYSYTPIELTEITLNEVTS